ncbi:MAG TPA: glycosyl hydrolase family 18 protein [Bacteroidales bacterium]|nr:glycosyl hydrolase family 18 protein [Bacteroidales bacterium]
MRIPYRFLLITIFLFFSVLLPVVLLAQGTEFQSIHVVEQQYYKTHPIPSDTPLIKQSKNKTNVHLKEGKMIFGYHPYWMNNSWGDYRWDLITDLCYFSYEVDASSGMPLTTNDFENAAVIDTALANGSRVHLCVTLFSGHANFFGNPQARKTLNEQIVHLVKTRGIQGVNIDFEAVPSSQAVSLTSYIHELRQCLDSAVPTCLLSMATPAVNWNNTFELNDLAQDVDFFMVMAYDYYWNLSTTAGPVSPLYPMETSYPYNVSQTIEYYLSEGVEKSKLLLGVPYYGRVWPVTQPEAPAPTRGSGNAVTYRNVRNNPTFFSWNNRRMNYPSRSIYYAYLANGWNHCFIDEAQTLLYKYQRVIASDLKGIGIWALGYDMGYDELWDAIQQAFSENGGMLCQDTLFDAGGSMMNPTFFVAQDLKILPNYPGPYSLKLFDLNLQNSKINIFDIQQPTGIPLSTVWPGTDSISLSNENGFYITFEDTDINPQANYSLTWSCPSAAIFEQNISLNPEIFFNPLLNQIQIQYSPTSLNLKLIQIYNLNGQEIFSTRPSGQQPYILNLTDNLPSGIYIVRLIYDSIALNKKLLLLSK